MLVVSSAPRELSDESMEARDEAHWAKVAANEEKLLKARERHQRRMEGYRDGSDSY